MSSFSNLKKITDRQVIIDFPWEDQNIKVCLKVLSVTSDLTAAAKARESATSAGVKEINEKNGEYSVRQQAEIVYRCTYECKMVEGEWKATDNRFFSSVEEICDNLDQDLLVYLHEYYQNFRSISRKNKEFTPENIAIISHKMGGAESDEDKADFFCRLPRDVAFSYIRFSAKLVLNLTETKSQVSSPSIPEHGTNIPLLCILLVITNFPNRVNK